ncbi:hypothetical protein B0T13DRAFT_403740, partial [Neurospora crassa]
PIDSQIFPNPPTDDPSNQPPSSIQAQVRRRANELGIMPSSASNSARQQHPEPSPSPSPSPSPPPLPPRTSTPLGAPTRRPTLTQTQTLEQLRRRIQELRESSRQLVEGITQERERWLERFETTWNKNQKISIRSKAGYDFLMEQIEPLTQLGEEQEKLESAMKNMSNPVKKQGLRIWFRMWVAWVPRKSATSNDEGSEDKLDEISREVVEWDKTCLRWEKQEFLKWTCGVEDAGVIADRNLEEEEIKRILEKQKQWAYELDHLNISSQVAWEMQLSHGIRWAFLRRNDDGRDGWGFITKPGDFIVPAFNARDLLELPELWVTLAPGEAGPRNVDTPMGKECILVTHHPPFLPTCVVFDGLRLYRTGKPYAGYIEYRTRDLDNENASRVRLILCVHRHRHKLGPGNESKNGER